MEVLNKTARDSPRDKYTQYIKRTLNPRGKWYYRLECSWWCLISLPRGSILRLFFLVDISKKPQLENAAGSWRGAEFKPSNTEIETNMPSIQVLLNLKKGSGVVCLFLSIFEPVPSSQGRGKGHENSTALLLIRSPVGSKALIILGEGRQTRLAHRFIYLFIFYCQARWSQKRQLVARNHRLCESQSSA